MEERYYQRDEIIVKISSEIVISKILGRHKWIDFLTLEYASRVIEKQRKDELSFPRSAYI